MLQPEKHYDFRARLDRVHRKDRRAPEATPAPGEFVLSDGVVIAYPAGSCDAVRETALDLADYLDVSMGVSATLKALPAGSQPPAGAIALMVDSAIGCRRAFRFEAGANGVRLTGADAGGVRRAGIYLEDRLNLREGPFLKPESALHKPLFSPRIVHSAWGLELYPDGQLNAILHAGFDAIILFYEGVDRTHIGLADFADIIRRAGRFGLDVYFYSYLPCERHPEDADAQDYYDAEYAEMFRHYPGLAGVMLCCEDMDFPSHDSRTCGGPRSRCGAFETRPSPAYFPCSDFPQLLRVIRDAVRKGNPEATVIFNTYSWGRFPEELRAPFLQNLPEGIMLQVTYDIFARRKLMGMPVQVSDYSVAADLPGEYFTGECRIASKRGLPIMCTSNTGGRTWDFGDAPYIPCPQRWMTRLRQLDQARREWGLCALYECHHYGWWPCVVTELAKAYFDSEQCDLEAELARHARRLAGDGASELLAAWEFWSRAFDYFPVGAEDQYGPLRVGPSYPMVFDTAGKNAPPFPCLPGAHFGNQIILSNYNPPVSGYPPSIRFPVEVEALMEFERLWTEGIAHHERAQALAHSYRTEELELELNMARFQLLCARTCRHMKELRLLYNRISTATSSQEILALFDQVASLFDAEEENARAAYPLVEVDSSLGWEGSMEYVCDAEHLDWKLKVLDGARRSLAECRTALVENFCHGQPA